MPKGLQSVQRRIRGMALAERLQGHVLDGKPMSTSQITAALGLLKKVSPDLKSVDVNNVGNSQLVVNIVDFSGDQTKTVDITPKKPELTADSANLEDML